MVMAYFKWVDRRGASFQASQCVVSSSACASGIWQSNRGTSVGLSSQINMKPFKGVPDFSLKCLEWVNPHKPSGWTPDSGRR